MAILVDKNTRVLVQGITGKEGRFHTGEMLSYGTLVKGGVSPGKGGTEILSLPVFNTVKEAVNQTGAEASVLFVPAVFAADGILEAVFAGLKLVVCITEGIPVKDFIQAKYLAQDQGARIIGPNCPGIITPGECKLGIMPARVFTPGKIGIISRSGTLTYQAADLLSKAGLGQSTVVGIGGDQVLGSSFVDILKLFAGDEKTEAVVVIGEIGGSQEEEAADFIRNTKMKAVAFIAGRSAPPGKKMGHAGAIISGNTGTAEGKIKAFENAGVKVAASLGDIAGILKETFKL